MNRNWLTLGLVLAGLLAGLLAGCSSTSLPAHEENLSSQTMSEEGQSSEQEELGAEPGLESDQAEMGQNSAQEGEEAQLEAEADQAGDQPIVGIAKKRELPEGFVYADEVLEYAYYDIRYYSEYNFVGEQIDGYHAPFAILSVQAAKALKKQNKRWNRWAIPCSFMMPIVRKRRWSISRNGRQRSRMSR